MPLPVRWGMRTVGKGFLKEYPFEEAYFLEKALQFREAVQMPLMLLGGINERATIEKAMELGFDYVAMGRALIFESGVVNRLAGGIGRASGRERGCEYVWISVVAVGLKKKNKQTTQE